MLTAAPFRGLPQPETHGRRKFNDRLSMNQLPRRALSRYGLTFQGNILSVNCQCRMLTRVRRTHSTSPVENSLITNPQEGEMSTENDEIINSLIRQINNFDKALQHAAARSDITLLAISFLASVMDKNEVVRQSLVDYIDSLQPGTFNHESFNHEKEHVKSVINSLILNQKN
ncbi:hypothetical protein [Escherichia coli]|uniref:hypothetical protein n=1 Tax=Escherichia coli TaxID=562 RepID=UPI001E3E1136|nr:hypothetical protein [Escherichia coli]MCC6093286.1 hypothetical protein [Escherichia coli]MCN1862490.1 hypothetical protein [Escherichia coli]MCN2949660.1 hypothetical protein [Escherichia coli]MCN3665745.1 hypothetical protein [Escherichia coli]MCO1298354.1 hypothetical protein [Escherichia coli]